MRLNFHKKTPIFAALVFVMYAHLWTVWALSHTLHKFMYGVLGPELAPYQTHLLLLPCVVIGAGFGAYAAKWSKPRLAKTLLVGEIISFAMFVQIIFTVFATAVFLEIPEQEAGFWLLPCVAAGAGFGIYAAKKASWPDVNYALPRLLTPWGLSIVAISNLFLYSSSALDGTGLEAVSIASSFAGIAGCALYMLNKTPLQYVAFWPLAFVVIPVIAYF